MRVVEILEKNGQGLNLTREVRDGIMNHSTVRMPSTMEGKVVRLADKIAYINHDIDDAIRGHIISEEQIPEEFTNILGHSLKERLNTLIHDVIEKSMDQPDIRMSSEIESAMHGLRQYMFQSVYTNPAAKGEEGKAQKIIQFLYEYYCNDPGRLPREVLERIWASECPLEIAVCDYIAGMTDQYCVDSFTEICVPKSWKIM